MVIAEYFKHISFTQPWFFAAGILIPLMVVWYILKNKKTSSPMGVSDISAEGLSSLKTSFRHLPFILRLLSVVCIITALANPQSKNTEQLAEGEGIDIIVCLDVSGSMTAQDLKPNRLEAAKNVISNFIDSRLTDRIGIVLFSGESFTQCPLTTDKGVLHTSVESIRIGLLQDGTAIGSGLGTSVDRLKESKAKSKVVILLTDGENNGGIIDPKTAKEIAKAFNVKVYTIGVGTDGEVETPENTPAGVVYRKQRFTLNESLLKEISFETGANYFRAKDNKGLQNIYAEIDELEKTKVEITSTSTYTDKFFPFVLAALILLFFEIIFRLTVFKKFP